MCPCRISFTGSLVITFGVGEDAAVITRRIRNMIEG
jgi:hypothetical protein